MAEDFARSRQYEYRHNSNLVLEADRERRRPDEGTGEVETLWGKLESQRMGDRVGRTVPAEVEAKKRKAEKKKRALREEGFDLGAEQRKKKKSSLDLGEDVLGTSSLAGGSYAPRTRESRAAFEEFLREARAGLGDAPEDVLRGAAEEVLYLLKEPGMNAAEKKREVSRLLGRGVEDESWAALERAAARIEDVGAAGTTQQTPEALDEDMGVAVVFDESDEDDDDAMAQDDEEDDDDDRRAGGDSAGPRLVTGLDEGAGAGDVDDDLLDVRDIDAHWLQRGLSKFYDDANVSAALAADALALLAGDDPRQVENRLVMLLDYDKFDFIKLLMKNRKRIYYCVKLAQAQDDDEREALRRDVAADVEGAAVLAALDQVGTAQTWAQDRAADVASRTRKEAVGLLSATRGADKEQTPGQSHNAGGVDRDDDADDADPRDGARGRTGPSDGAVEDARKARAAARKTLDLTAMGFAARGHVMTNRRCELPADAWRAQKQGYEEVHVPALRKPNVDAPLVSIAELPAWVRPAFQGMETLNPVQSKVMPAALESVKNLLLCAPTGAGKTNCALLAMLNVFAAYRTDPGDSTSTALDLDAFKIVYIAPMKALVQECVLNFGRRLAPYGVTVRELSGDAALTYAQLQETQIIVSTPEKWDIVTRKAGDRAYTRLVRLVIIDEIHLLHDERGPVLEALVARTIRGVEETRDNVRMVGLSATLPNYKDVARFLRVDEDEGLFYFDNAYRPVPLQQQYVGLTEKKALKRYQLMNEICFEKVLARAGKHQTLIFVHSRADTAKTATALRDLALERDAINAFVRPDSATREILQEEASSAKHDALKELLPYGFAIHHAGLTRADRNLVEDLFADKHVQVLCATSTLAWGVNLPAHTVIIKGTQVYSPDQGKWVELSPLDVVQMMGRAGRPQYDADGEGIILTKHAELQFYLSLMNQQLPVESQLATSLPDHLNAEIEMGAVQNLRQAADWLAYTYWHVRACEAPSRYGVEEVDRVLEEDIELDAHRLDVAHSAAVILDQHNLIKYEPKIGSLQITPLGRVAAHYYVSYKSMALYNEHLKPGLSDIELFRLFAASGEFQNVRVREEEKLELAKLVTRVPIPIKEAPDEPSAKVNALLQAYISNLSLEGFALVADMTYVRQSANRLCRAIFEMALKRRWALLATKALTLCKMVERRLWQSQSPLRQFKGVPESIVRKLEKKDVAWDRFYDLKPQDLAELVKLPKMGKTLHRLVHQIPRLELSAHVQPVSRGLLKVELILIPDFQFDPKVHDHSLLFHVLVEDVDGAKILHHEPFVLRSSYADDEHLVEFSVPVADPLPPQYFVKVVSDRWLHSTAVLPVSFKHLILPRKFAPHVDLLDLQPLPVTALNLPAVEPFYRPSGLEGNGSYFNAVQTQTFGALYESDENVLVCAPNGSGKLALAEFAVLRALRQAGLLDDRLSLDDDDDDDDAVREKRAQPCVVYVAPKAATVARRTAAWTSRFQRRLGIKVAELSGDVAADLKTLATTPIVTATASKWDVLSRRWKQRKAVQKLRLFVADELQCIGDPLEGPTLEVVVSRMRYISSQLDARAPRIVGLGASVADAKDLGDWIGADRLGATCFSFHSNVRPTPLELLLHAFDTPNYAARLLAMSKVLFQVFKRHKCAVYQRPALVFVSSRKQCQLTAIDAMVYFATQQSADDQDKTHQDDDDAAPDAAEVEAVHDPALGQTLSKGVAFTHAGLSASDRRRVDRLYREGRIRVLVAPAEACWELEARASLVVVMATERYEGREHRYVDYAAPDVLEMIGKAGRPGLDEEAKCAVFCHTPKKEYLKRLLYDPLPVESQLDRALHDHLNAEIVAKTIESKQDAVDYLTWTFFYRRLTQNPNFYDLQGVTHRHVSDHLSEAIENVVSDLADSKCVAVEDDVDLAPLNLGMIAAYYCIQYTTIELFASSVGPKTKIPALLEILASAAEYASLPTRFGEDAALEKLAAHLPRFKLPQLDGGKHKHSGGADEYDDRVETNTSSENAYSKAHVKALILLHSHFARHPLSSELAADRDAVLRDAPRLLQALVDVISSNGWLAPALHVMEISQMVTQGLWVTDHPLLQIPYVNRDAVRRAKAEVERDPDLQIDGVLDLLALEDDVRDRVLDVNDPKNLAAVAAFCNDYPNMELNFALVGSADVRSGEAASLSIQVEREVDDDMTNIGAVRGRFPGPKKEAWWLVVADLDDNAVLAIKRVTLMQHLKLDLDFLVPDAQPGNSNTTLTLYFMSDAYLGCDQEHEFTVTVLPPLDD